MLAQKGTKKAPGAFFDEHSAYAGVHRRRPLDPRFTGVLYWEPSTCVRRLRTQDHAFFLPRGHWPLPVQNLVEKCVEMTPPPLAKPGRLVRSCWPRLPDHARTEQVGRHQAVYVRIQRPSNLYGSRPQWAEMRRTHGQILGPPEFPYQPKGHAPVKWGPGQAACEHPLREGAHRRRPRRFFGSFLIAQKGTSLSCIS